MTAFIDMMSKSFPIYGFVALMQARTAATFRLLNQATSSAKPFAVLRKSFKNCQASLEIDEPVIHPGAGAGRRTRNTEFEMLSRPEPAAATLKTRRSACSVACRTRWRKKMAIERARMTRRPDTFSQRCSSSLVWERRRIARLRRTYP